MRIVMMGTGTFAEPTFEALIAAGATVVGLVTQPERDTGRKGSSTRQTGKGMASIATSAGIPVVQPESINTPDGLAQLQAFNPELLVVAAYGQILSKDVISTPTHGAINVHASLLPKYRGAAPIAHAILNGESSTGVTIIRITPGLDAGEMLAQEAVDIHPTETTGELETRLAPLGARLCIDVLQRMKNGPVLATKQDQSLVTKAPKMKKEMGLIDWTRPADVICNHVRAMQPWPTAYTYFHRPGKEPMRVIITRAEVCPSPQSEPPLSVGEFSKTPAPGKPLQVWCSPDLLSVLELQPAGKNRMTAEEFVRGYPVQNGYRFGPNHFTTEGTESHREE